MLELQHRGLAGQGVGGLLRMVFSLPSTLHQWAIECHQWTGFLHSSVILIDILALSGMGLIQHGNF